ncbi:MAG TPA: tripartite tricarboxylate transporter substrate binding protein [Pseudolabrys sp.]|jgi:tripartite-type tricarboxylate transporter receptor subunit TctC
MRWLLAPFVSLLLVASAGAQDAYPSRPVRVIVGLAAGSSTDVTARIIAQKMGAALGQTFIVENRPGAGGNIATGFVAHNPPDGYTLLFGSASVTVNATLMPNAGFDLVKDLTPIVLLAGVPNILVVHPSLGVKTVDELIAKAKSKPGEISYASSGIGTSPHLSAELFSMMTGVKLVHVPYKGSPQAMTDLMAGQTSMMFVPAPTAVSQLKSGNLIALASTQLKRTATAPDLPTLDELGLKGFDTGVWFGLFAPAGTPKEIVDKLAKAANDAIAAEDVRAAFAPQGIDPIGGTPDQFAAYVKSEIAKWAKVIEIAGVKPQ